MRVERTSDRANLPLVGFEEQMTCRDMKILDLFVLHQGLFAILVTRYAHMGVSLVPSVDYS